MDRILDIAGKHGLTVIEDCAHALGASYRGRPAGALGDAAFFSFQTLKPLNTYGGGMAVARDPALSQRISTLARSEPWPDDSEVLGLLRRGRVQRVFVRPGVFRWTLFPILWAASVLRARPDVYLWEPIRRLDPIPPAYRRRYSNVQAVLGLEGLRRLDEWTAATRRNAAVLTEAVGSIAGVQAPAVPPDRTHAFYQYCLYVPDRDRLVQRCIRRGLDIETLHVDVCTRLALFEASRTSAPGADRAAEVVQLPVYASLTEDQVRWVCDTVRAALHSSARWTTSGSAAARG
jgi:dTDP-4-amino-4,6-dideoxygalactose transaminase